MTQDASEGFVGGSGNIYVAEYGTTMPNDISDVLDAGFKEMGFLTPDGFRMTPNTSTVDLHVWQVPDVVRTLVTERSLTLAMDFIQGSEDTMILYFGGGSFSGGVYTPPTGSSVHHVSLVADVFDGTTEWRFWFPKVTVATNREVQFVRSDFAKWGVDLSVLKVDSDTPLFGFDSTPAIPAYP